MLAKAQIKLTARDCKKYFYFIDDQSWCIFDEWIKQKNSVHYINNNKQEWLKSTCSCSFWAKNLFCQHIIGLAVYKKKCQFTETHMQIPIGQNRIRGQPKKTKSALTHQNDYISTSSSESDSSDPDSYVSPFKQKNKKKTP